MLGFLYADDLTLCAESEEDQRAMVGRFAEVCRRRGLKVNAFKSKVIVLGGEEGLEYEVCVDAIRLQHVSEFKYFGCVLDESGSNETECSRKVASWRRVAGAIRSLVNARGLQDECALVLHESLLVLVLTYGSETIIWRRRRGLGLGLHRWITAQVCWVSGEWIKSRIHGSGSCAG